MSKASAPVFPSPSLLAIEKQTLKNLDPHRQFIKLLNPSLSRVVKDTSREVSAVPLTHGLVSGEWSTSLGHQPNVETPS